METSRSDRSGAIRRVLRVGGFLAALLWPPSALAQDPFEIQVYDSLTAPKGDLGFELHLNHDLDGTRATSSAGELPTAGVTHLTLEPHLGISGWAELGMYLQTALRPDGSWQYAGAKARFKARAGSALDGRLGLALNAELSAVPRAYEPAVYGGELRPIVDWREGRFYASVNPIVSFALTGADAFHPAFEPAAKVSWSLSPALAVGPEYYGAWGTLLPAEPNGPAVHRLFGVVDWTSPWLDVEAGLGYGFTGPERWIAKAILGLHPPGLVLF